jgi:hypothetical protein
MMHLQIEIGFQNPVGILGEVPQKGCDLNHSFLCGLPQVRFQLYRPNKSLQDAVAALGEITLRRAFGTSRRT